ncbi:ring-infected erythrocyte surface antigen [Plasmodium falciparum UGT5.1]|uniref:Ring-infected erythrocyte surface antigen n=1 Tax=Plasmodium falciparum UGT5.1 TaxID=1237627 RepID=W7JUR7_PLAFA|nr:ring-infected erythrocyte surface antigen [Plasmodium falciparum UGT5.1]
MEVHLLAYNLLIDVQEIYTGKHCHQVFGLPFEKPTFTLESPPDIDHTNILGFNEKFMTDVNRYRYSNNYEAIPHISEFNPLIVDKVLFDYNEKVDNLGRSGGDIIKKMQTLWDEIMDINKRKYDSLKEKLQKTYSQYKVQYDMPKEAYESKWTQCIKLIDQGGENLEERLNSQFKNWYRQKYLNLEEYRRLTVLNQIAWKALSNQIQYSCRKIMNSDISSFKHINELKSLEHRAAKAAEAEMKKRAQKPKKKKSRRGWLCCGGGDIETVEPQQEEPVQTVQEQQVNEYGDILPSLRASITNSAINYYDTVKDGVYLDHETSDALYTDEDLLFDLEKQKYMDMLDTSEEEFVEENEEEHTVDDEHVEEHTADDEHVEEPTVADDEHVEEPTVADEHVEEPTVAEEHVEEPTVAEEHVEEPASDVQQTSEAAPTIEIPDTLYYDILGVGVNADMNEITERYFKLAENYYPYQRSGSTVFHNFRKVNEAYQVLGDIDKKRWYNKYGYDGIKQVNFMNPSIFYLLSSLEKFKDFTGTPQIVTLLRFFFEKRLSMNDLENKSEHLLKFMEQYQKEREAHVSEYLLNILQPCIAGDSKWNVPIITKLEGLKGSRFDIPILESLRWIFKHVAKTHLKKSSKSAKKLQQRTQANKQELANINNNLMSTLKEYLGSSEQMNSITYNFENINSNVDNGNQSKNISDLSYTDQKEILEKIVSYIVDISLYDIENTALNAAEQLLSDNSVDEKTLKKRAQSLKKLSSIMERYAGGKRNDKKAKKYDTQDVVGYIMHGISTINKEMKNQNENVPEHVQHNAEANVEHDAEENVMLKNMMKKMLKNTMKNMMNKKKYIY